MTKQIILKKNFTIEAKKETDGKTVYFTACIEKNKKPMIILEEVSTPGQTHTGLGPRVYPFTTPGCCTA